MALNRDKIGTEYPTYTYTVTRVKIHEYAAALGETDPRYFSDGDDCVAPPTFAACFTITAEGPQAVFADEDLGVHPALVHGSQAYEFGERPLEPGDVLECTPRIADIRARGRNEFMTLEIDCRFADDGEHAVTAENVIVFLGSAPQDDDGAEDGA
ncbi:MAG: MaoC family dehydratase N-terminal domain-containing protein [Actinobacteria bacterium]|nr:MaoC family dehydratase N-terminal domain-containing protein [Actinomycetota bacterium]